ncbi:hypothetical protein KAU15_06340, partial [candidate division WOR-3 bacterium]|nr:hypothetical protein [candidate division WOR-3 bacterium]
MNSIINYFECTEYYEDGKLICKLYDYDDGLNNPDKIELDAIENYDYIGMLYKDIKIGDIIAGNKIIHKPDESFDKNRITMTPYARTQAYFNENYVNTITRPLLSKVRTVYPNQAVIDNGGTPYLGGYKCPIISLYPNDVIYPDGQRPIIKYYLTLEDRNLLGITDEDIRNGYFIIYQINDNGDLNELITAHSTNDNGDMVFYIDWANTKGTINDEGLYYVMLRTDETDTKKPYEIEICSKTKQGIRIKGRKDAPNTEIGFMITDPMESIYEALYWYNEKQELAKKRSENNLFDLITDGTGIDDTLMVYVYTGSIESDSTFDILIPNDSLFDGHNRIFVGNGEAFKFALSSEETPRIIEFEPCFVKDDPFNDFEVKNTTTEMLDFTYNKTPPEIVFIDGYELPANILSITDKDTIRFTATRAANIGLFLYDINGNEIVSKVYKINDEDDIKEFIWDGWLNGEPAEAGDYYTVLIAYDEEGYVSDQETGYFEVYRNIPFEISSPDDNKWISGMQELRV